MQKYVEILKNSDNLEKAGKLDNLTEIQRRRLDALTSGQSRSHIAFAEHVSPHAVSNSFFEIVRKLAKGSNQ